jgi:hypothetical protein
VRVLTLRRGFISACSLLAACGAGAFLSLFVMVAAVHFTEVSAPEDDWVWVWVVLAWWGLVGAMFFGAAAVMLSAPSGRLGTRARRIGLGVLGLMCLFAGAWLLAPGTLYGIGALVMAVGAAALAVLWRDVRRERGGE